MRSVLRGVADALTGAVFRTVEIQRPEPEPPGPVLTLINHGGGLFDILLAIKASDRFPRFLARDVIWKVPLGSAVMNAVGGIPVHRREDHGGAADNTGMFDDAYDALADGDLLVIYPEGESVPVPQLSPLRTGAARIAVGALARGTDAWIQPTGLHYFDVSVLRARALVDCGPGLRTSEAVHIATQHLDPPGPISEDNHELVHAVTAVFTERLEFVAEHYDDWEERRLYEMAATTFLQQQTDDPRKIPYSEIALLAREIAAAPGEDRQRVDVSAQAYAAELELLGVSELDVSRGGMVGLGLARQVAQVVALAPLAAYGLAVNGAGIAGVSAISMTGMAPATAASVKPAFAAVAFPALWAGLGIGVGRRWGVWAGLAAAASGPVSLAATIRVGERGQMLLLLTRALRRAKGPLLEQVVATRDDMVAAVGAVVEDAMEQARHPA